LAKTNISNRKAKRTHEGAPARQIPVDLQLRRSVLACLLWERQFYEDGVEIASRISELIPKVNGEKVAALAVEAREKMKLRHMPLFIVREMARIPSHRPFVADTLNRVIQRADELSEFVAMYWKEGKQPLSAQVKKGLAAAFTKFDGYQLAKYNRGASVKLRDVLFMVHARPLNDEQAELWMKLVEDRLEAPDTWEVALSSGADRKETWERLLRENRLGGLALLRNLRNMINVGVDEDLVIGALRNMKTERILPFRFIAAARYAPRWESELEKAMFTCLEGSDRMPGRTVLLVDVSGSMDSPLSSKSEMIRMDAACGLAVLARELCEKVEVYTFSSHLKEVPDRRGFALRDAIINSQQHQSTLLGEALKVINRNRAYDRIIVITDEQSHDEVPAPHGKGFVINVASYKNGVGYGKWNHIDGWSEAVLKYISELEQFNSSME
jgi:hypothetical protein